MIQVSGIRATIYKAKHEIDDYHYFVSFKAKSLLMIWQYTCNYVSCLFCCFCFSL